MSRRARGELEAAVLRVLWDSDTSLSASDLRSRLASDGHVPALTTVLTVLDRLVVKGHVERTEGGERGLRFASARSESAYAAQGMVDALVWSRDREATLLSFAGRLSRDDQERLRTALLDGSSPARRKR